jgi:hypothetical protein
MATAHTMGWGIAGAATTMVARTMTRRMMHAPSGRPRLPRAARRTQSFGMMLLLAAAAGTLLALGDVFNEQRKHVAQAPQ